MAGRPSSGLGTGGINSGVGGPVVQSLNMWVNEQKWSKVVRSLRAPGPRKTEERICRAVSGSDGDVMRSTTRGKVVAEVQASNPDLA